MRRDTVYHLFPLKIRKLFEQAELDVEKLQEARMRVDRPLLLRYDGEELGITEEGALTKQAAGSHVVSDRELREALEYVSGYSMYAFDEEMRQGFITVPGGHRVGIAGRIVMEGERVNCIRHISFLNIRLSHEKKGCADTLMPLLLEGRELCHTLIISPPRCGKTTLLRDVIRQVSEGFGDIPGQTVGVVDERSEIGGCYLGVPQNDLGIRTDVLDCCGKAEGMMMLLRSMSPQVIAVDEIGSSEDGRAIEAVFHCGCKLISTVHGGSVEDIQRKPLLQRLVKSHAFERYVILGGDRPGRVREVFDSRGTLLFRELGREKNETGLQNGGNTLRSGILPSGGNRAGAGIEAAVDGAAGAGRAVGVSGKGDGFPPDTSAGGAGGSRGQEQNGAGCSFQTGL